MSDTHRYPLRSRKKSTSSQIEIQDDNNSAKLFDSSDLYILMCGNNKMVVGKKAMEKCSAYVRSFQSFTKHSNAMSDTPLEKEPNNVFHLDDLDTEGVWAAVGFVNSGTVELHMDTLASVIQAADFLAMQTFLTFIEKYLISTITMKNCTGVLKVTMQFEDNSNLDGIFEIIRNFIIKNIREVSKEQFNSLSHQQLALILSDHNLKILSEVTLITVVKDWMQVNKGVNWTESVGDIDPTNDVWVTFADLMSKIRWPLIGADFLTEIDEDVKAAMLKIEDCCYFLGEAVLYHKPEYIHRQPFMQTRDLLRVSRTHPRCNDTRCIVSLDAEDVFGEYDDEVRPLAYNVYNLVTRQTKTITSPDSHCKLVMCQVDTYLFACGGYTEATDQCYRYDPRFNKWLKLSSMLTARASHVLVHAAETSGLYAIGGRDENDELLQSCEFFDIVENKWIFFKDIPVKVSHHAGCIHQNTEITPSTSIPATIYISGGEISKIYPNSPNPNRTYLVNRVYKYEISCGEWHQCANMPVSRKNHDMMIIGEFMYAVGGKVSFLRSSFTIDRYDISLDAWTTCRQELDIMSTASYENKDQIVILGHSDYSNKVQLCRFSEDLDEIDLITLLPYLKPQTGCVLACFPYQFWSDV